MAGFLRDRIIASAAGLGGALYGARPTTVFRGAHSSFHFPLSNTSLSTLVNKTTHWGRIGTHSTF